LSKHQTHPQEIWKTHLLFKVLSKHQTHPQEIWKTHLLIKDFCHILFLLTFRILYIPTVEQNATSPMASHKNFEGLPDTEFESVVETEKKVVLNLMLHTINICV
jgi:hypothetical protein